MISQLAAELSVDGFLSNFIIRSLYSSFPPSILACGLHLYSGDKPVSIFAKTPSSSTHPVVDNFTFAQVKDSRPLSSVTEETKACFVAFESRSIKRGIDIEARIPSIARTAINSMRVKPEFLDMG